MKYEHTPRPSAEKSRSTVAVLLEPGGYFDSQTTDSQYYGFSESQTTGYIPEQPFDMDCSDGSEYSPECYGFSQPVDLINEQEVHTESKPDDASNTFIVPPGYKFMTPADRLLHEDESYANFRPSAMDLPILKRWGTDAERAYAKESLVEKHLGDPLTYAERSHSEDFIAACGETAVSGSAIPIKHIGISVFERGRCPRESRGDDCHLARSYVSDGHPEGLQEISSAGDWLTEVWRPADSPGLHSGWWPGGGRWLPAVKIRGQTMARPPDRRIPASWRCSRSL
ncbi:hypothetical protein C8R44DRAFT_729005 [Mycena epipterygia]|nr:hypothetical protein C8R44DRAFT_729005 [Mycena epipterygia]